VQQVPNERGLAAPSVPCNSMNASRKAGRVAKALALAAQAASSGQR